MACTKEEIGEKIIYVRGQEGLDMIKLNLWRFLRCGCVLAACLIISLQAQFTLFLNSIHLYFVVLNNSTNHKTFKQHGLINL